MQVQRGRNSIDWQIFTKVKATHDGYSAEFVRSDLSDKSYHDRFIINLGIGMDYSLTNSLYIRSILNYGIGLHKKPQKELRNLIRDAGYDISFLNHGPTLKFAIGYKF